MLVASFGVGFNRVVEVLSLTLVLLHWVIYYRRSSTENVSIYLKSGRSRRSQKWLKIEPLSASSAQATYRS